MSMSPAQYEAFRKRLEETGERCDFEIVVRTARSDIQLTSTEITEALYALVNQKAEALPGDKPHFDIEVSTYSVSLPLTQIEI